MSSRESDSAYPPPRQGGAPGRRPGEGGDAYPSGTPPYGTGLPNGASPFEPVAQPGAAEPGPAEDVPKTETTLTTRVRINIPGSRPIPPVVVRSTVKNDEAPAEPAGPRHRSGTSASPVLGVVDAGAPVTTPANLPPEWQDGKPGASGSGPGGSESTGEWFRPRQKGRQDAGPAPVPAGAPAPTGRPAAQSAAAAPAPASRPAPEPPAGPRPTGTPASPFGPDRGADHAPSFGAGPDERSGSPFGADPFVAGPPASAPAAAGQGFQPRTGGKAPRTQQSTASGRPGEPEDTRIGGFDPVSDDFPPSAAIPGLPANGYFGSAAPAPAGADPFAPNHQNRPGPAGGPAGGPGSGPGAGRPPRGRRADAPYEPGDPAPAAGRGYPNGADPFGTGPTGPPQPDPYQSGPAQPDPFQPDPFQPGAAQSDPFQPGGAFSSGAFPSNRAPGGPVGAVQAPGGPAPSPAPGPGDEAAAAAPAKSAPAAGAKPRRGRASKLAVYAIGFLLFGGAAAYGTGLMLNQADIPKGTTVLGTDIGGDTRDQAISALDSSVGKTGQLPVKLKIGDQTVDLDPATAGLSFDTTATVDGLTHHSYNPVEVIGSLAGGSKAVAPEVRVDRAKLKAALDALGAKSGQGVQEGFVQFTADGQTVVVPGKAGQAVDTAGALDQVEQAYRARAAGEATPVLTLPVTAAQPKVSQDALKAAADGLGKSVLNGNVTVWAGTKKFDFGKVTASKALTLVPDASGQVVLKWDLDKLNDALKGAFDKSSFKKNGALVPITPQDVADGISSVFDKTTAKDRVFRFPS